MPSLAIIGAQWGDEGKGKIIDYLSQFADGVVRFQGGPNAGHTVVVGDKKMIFHQLPSGLLNPSIKAYITQGCVIDLSTLKAELEELKKFGVKIEGRLFIDERAHLILPYHKLLDKAKEERKRKEKIGTTQRGIGPAYEDKYARTGIVLGDLRFPEIFEEKLKRQVSLKNYILMELYAQNPISEKELLIEFLKDRELFFPLITDCAKLILSALQKGERIIFEGAQGTLLDIGFGTYPYVTSSTTIAGGIGGQVGIPPQMINEVVGVAKAYTTRVGNGPFPSELKDEVGRFLQKKGKEFGAATGRVRRCGWFDCGIIRYASQINGFKKLILTKLDVLSGLSEIKIADGYFYQGEEIRDFNPCLADYLKPKYITLSGFQEDLRDVNSFSDLPKAALDYLALIEKLTGCEIVAVSVGEQRENLILKEKFALFS